MPIEIEENSLIIFKGIINTKFSQLEKKVKYSWDVCIL